MRPIGHGSKAAILTGGIWLLGAAVLYGIGQFEFSSRFLNQVFDIVWTLAAVAYGFAPVWIYSKLNWYFRKARDDE